MTTLDGGFEAAAREGMIDNVEQRCRDEVAPELAADIKDRLEAYGQRHDYDVRAMVSAT